MAKPESHVNAPFPIYEASLRGVDRRTVNKQAFLQRYLKDLNLLGVDFGYRACNPTRLELIAENGTDRSDEEVYICELEKAILDEPATITHDTADVFYYLEENRDYETNTGMIVIYHKRALARTEYGGVYKFKDLKNKVNAVAAVIMLTDVSH